MPRKPPAEAAMNIIRQSRFTMVLLLWAFGIWTFVIDITDGAGRCAGRRGRSPSSGEDSVSPSDELRRSSAMAEDEKKQGKSFSITTSASYMETIRGPLNGLGNLLSIGA